MCSNAVNVPAALIQERDTPAQMAAPDTHSSCSCDRHVRKTYIYITKYIKQHLANFKIYSVLSHSYPPPHRTAANSCKNGKSASMLQKFCSRVSVSLRIFLQPGHRHQGQDRGHGEDPRHNAAPHLKLRQHRGSSSTAAGKSIVQLCLQYCHLNNLH